MKTLIQGGDVVAYAEGGHRLVRGGALVFENDRVTFVGRSFTGSVDRRIDAVGKLVIPGLVNIHCHADVEAGGRLIADIGRRDFFHTGFLNYYSAKKGVKPLGPRQDPDIGGRFALPEMLRNGCTTVVDIVATAEAHARIAGELGLRAFLSPTYRSADYCVSETGQLYYEHDEAGGLAGLDRAKAFIGKHAGSYEGRIQGMLFPYQVDTCSPTLLRATRKAADELGVGLGTDTYPRDLISEMRWASNLCKIVENDFTLGTAADVFTAATLGGARALRRDDLGRLAPGAKADIVLINMRSFRMGPYRDPIKALVQCGTSDDVDQVIVDGETRVEDGHVVGLDEARLLAEAQAEADRLWATVPEWHWQGLTADQLSPQSFPPLTTDLGR